ncbi:MAG: FeoB-associated Cys-rich membrane protein [Ruminococcus sp.]
MASLILLIVLAVYCIWLLRHMAKRRKEKHGKCVDCPYRGDWNVPIKAAFCPNRRTLFRIAGYGFKPLTRTVFLHMLKIQLNNDLIV